MYKNLLRSVVLVFGLLKSDQYRNWDTHSAYMLKPQRWEVGLFQPFRYGYSENLEISTHPLWFFILPNIAIKKPARDLLGHKVARRIAGYYPTPLLNMLSRSNIGGLIDPNITMPPMVAISGSIICSQEVKGFDYSLKAGFEIGQVFGELDSRSNIDLPMVYHRLGVFFNGWGVYGGVDIQKEVLKNTKIHIDFDLRLLPGLSAKNKDRLFRMFGGEKSLEHKLLLIMRLSENIRFKTGYKLIAGDFPYGKDVRMLPYIPLIERWVPLIEVEWSGNVK